MQEGDGTPGFLCPQIDTFLLDVDQPSPLKTIFSSVPMKSKTQQGHWSICCHWAPFSADQFVCTVKMLVFPNQNSNIKTKTPNKLSAWKFLWMKCPKVRGTLPAQSLLLKGSLHLPFYKKTM